MKKKMLVLAIALVMIVPMAVSAVDADWGAWSEHKMYLSGEDVQQDNTDFGVYNWTEVYTTLDVGNGGGLAGNRLDGHQMGL